MAATKNKEEEMILEEQQEEMISIRLPLTKELKDDVFVRVNHDTWLIKRGVTVRLPRRAVEVLEHAEEAEQASMLYQMEKERENL